jgi:hypothetical protein
VARLSGDGEIFAYFFGPMLAKQEGSFYDVRIQNALLSGRCSDLGLLKCEWPLAGQLRNWNRDDWPLPPLYREDMEAKKAWLSYYDNDNMEFIREESIEYGKAQYTKYSYDRLMGYGAVEIRLTKLMKSLGGGNDKSKNVERPVK